MSNNLKNILDYKSIKVEADKLKIAEVLKIELLKFKFDEDYLKEGDLQVLNASEITFHTCVIENYTDTRCINEANRPNRSGIQQGSKWPSEFNAWDYKLSYNKEFQNSSDNHDIFESHHAIGCSACKQHGKINCSSCGATGKVECSSCDGRGEKPCSNCDGKVNIKCWSCSGKGTRETGYGDNKRTERCSSCSGGSNKCTSCSNGWITCSKCSGDRKVTCYNCDGSGDVTCYKCDGYRTMDHFFIVTASFVNLSQTLYLTNPYPGFDQNKSNSFDFNIQNKLFSIQELKFNENYFDDIKSSPFYRQITSFFDFTNNDSTKLITSRINFFDNKYFEVSFNFYGEKYSLFLDKNLEKSYYNGKKPSDQYELDLLKKTIDTSVKNELSITKKTIQKLTNYDFISISEKEIINAIEDTENIYEAHVNYNDGSYKLAESRLKLVSKIKNLEFDFLLLRKKLDNVYRLNTFIFWFISLIVLSYFLIDTSFYWISINISVAFIYLLTSLYLNKYYKNINHSRFNVVALIITHIISINIIFTPERKKIACDCYNQTVLKSGMAYDYMTYEQQKFREKCFSLFGTELNMKYASEFFPNNSTSGANFNIKNDTSVKEIIDNEYVNNNNLVDSQAIYDEEKKSETKKLTQFQISTSEARSIYNLFSEAIINENSNQLLECFAPVLAVWHRNINIQREQVVSDWESTYSNKWSVVKDELLDITVGSREREFNYNKNYIIRSKSNSDDERTYEISGYFIVDENSKIVEMKDVKTVRKRIE